MSRNARHAACSRCVEPARACSTGSFRSCHHHTPLLTRHRLGVRSWLTAQPHTPEELPMTATTATDFTTLTGTYTFDTAHSRLGFVARHAMVTKVRGAFNEFEGSAVDRRHRTRPTRRPPSTVQVASVDTRNAQRDGHLRTNDFLDVENYPKITFTSTSIAHVGGNDFEVTGDLTIKDVTKSDHDPARVPGRGHRPVRQPAHRLRGQHPDRAQRLRRHLQRRARDRRRARQRQDHPRVRDLGHQGVGFAHFSRRGPVLRRDRPRVAPLRGRLVKGRPTTSRRSRTGRVLFTCPSD